EANTSITNLQSDVFRFRASISGTVSISSGTNSLPQGLAGITVQLLDSNNNILATTVTNFAGRYQFTQLNGVSTVTYTVHVVLPSNMRASSTSRFVQISRGDVDLSGVDFLVQQTRKWGTL